MSSSKNVHFTQKCTTMAEESDGEWKKGQEVEIYETSRQQWVPGKICYIKHLSDSKQKKYYIEYEEYAQMIREEDSKSLMRIPKIQEQSDDSELNQAFSAFSKRIPNHIPLSRQIQHSSGNVSKTCQYRMNRRILSFR